MIYSLRGKLIEVGESFAVVECAGVGYLCSTTRTTLNSLPPKGEDVMLYTYLKKSKGYFDGTRVLIDGGKTFRDFIRANKESQKLIKKLIAQVSGVAVPIGPYESKTVNRASANAEESLRKLEQLGLEVSIEDSERKKR